MRVFENYSLVSVPFSDAEAVVGQLNASGGRRRIAKIDGSDAENGGGKRRRPATGLRVFLTFHTENEKNKYI